MKDYRCVIIGAGFAGAATAYHLARRRWGDVLLLEREEKPGVHSSGRSAGMIRQVVSDPALLSLAREGACFFKDPPDDWPGGMPFDPSGSLLLGAGESWQRLLQEREKAAQVGIPVEIWPPSKIVRRVPVLERADCEGGLWSPEDGVVDATRLLSMYVEAAVAHGADVVYGSPVREIRVRGDSILGIETHEGFISAGTVVNAAGAWAGEIGKKAGGIPVLFRPSRRHLFFSGALPWVDPAWPFVWDVTHQIYFRPEAGGLLLSPCDEDPAPPGIPEPEKAVADLLAEKIESYLPAMPRFDLKSSRAGLRTLTPDGRFVIGWDPGVLGFLWVAGLGGHGVTTSYAVGALAADIVMGATPIGAEAFFPARFQAA